MLVEGEVGIGDGWWLTLHAQYEGGLDEQDHLMFEQDTKLILPQTIACEPGSGPTPAELMMEIVADLRANPQLELADLGSIDGLGWNGHLFREVIDAERAEFQLLGLLAAPDTVLSLAVRFIGTEGEVEARRIIADVVHAPESRSGMNELIRSNLGIT
jgi:hypothetical protein